MRFLIPFIQWFLATILFFALIVGVCLLLVLSVNALESYVGQDMAIGLCGTLYLAFFVGLAASIAQNIE